MAQGRNPQVGARAENRLHGVQPDAWGLGCGVSPDGAGGRWLQWLGLHQPQGLAKLLSELSDGLRAPMLLNVQRH